MTVTYYDCFAVWFRKVGCFEAANLYAEWAHQHRTGSGYAPRRPVLALDERIRLSETDPIVWDDLSDEGVPLPHHRPFGPTKQGSRSCSCGSLASGGNKPYCACDACF